MGVLSGYEFVSDHILQKRKGMASNKKARGFAGARES